MLRSVVVLLGLAVLAGCASDKKEAPTKMAAFAANAQYPRDVQANRDMPLVALLNRDQTTIRLINPTDQSMQNVNVWINGEYVQQVDTIPAHSTTRLNATNFYGNNGRSLTTDKVNVSRIEVQTGNTLHAVNGPVLE